MERIEALIEKLREQSAQNADPNVLLGTVQLLQFELTRLRSAAPQRLGTAKVSVVLPAQAMNEDYSRYAPRPVAAVAAPKEEEQVNAVLPEVKEVKEEKESRTCFKIECKTICIPPVRLPWQACPPMTATTRKVRVLVEDSYECPKCKYTWKVVEPSKAEPAEAPSGGAATTRPPVITATFGVDPRTGQSIPTSAGRDAAGQPIASPSYYRDP